VVASVGELEETSALFREFSNAVELSKLLGNAQLPVTWITILGSEAVKELETYFSSFLIVDSQI
jgi:hypothetical protein